MAGKSGQFERIERVQNGQSRIFSVSPQSHSPFSAFVWLFVPTWIRKITDSFPVYKRLGWKWFGTVIVRLTIVLNGELETFERMTIFFQLSVLNLKRIFMKNWHLIEQQPLLSEIYRNPLLISYKRGRSLNVRAKLWKAILNTRWGVVWACQPHFTLIVNTQQWYRVQAENFIRNYSNHLKYRYSPYSLF